jgi:prepilin-type N-terminal cleavage/methylation domain-containing protein
MAALKLMKNNKGYSLVEIMLVVAVLGIISSIAPVLLTKTFEFFTLTTAKTTIQRDLRASMEMINKNLRQASAATIIIDQYSTDQPPCSRITFTKQNETTSYVFYQLGNKLMMGRGVVAAKKLCDNVRFISFTFPHSNDLTICSVAMTLEIQTYKGKSKAIHIAIEKVRIMNE